LFDFLGCIRIRLAARLATFPQPIDQRRDGNFRVGVQADCNPRKPSKGIRSVIDLDNLFSVFEYLPKVS
jgi:hypothetical protein